MKDKIPFLSKGTRICIVCEGDEEFEYISKLKELNVWDDKYDIVPKNAHGNGNVSAIYQDNYQSDAYDCVLVFCDTERKPYNQYNDIKRKINEFHGVENCADEVVMFGNPCTMQIILQHWREVQLKSPAKKINAEIIKDCTGIDNYKAHKEQREQMFKLITNENYSEMLLNVKKLSDDDTVIGSSNFDRFMNNFSNNDKEWIKEINNKLESIE